MPLALAACKPPVMNGGSWSALIQTAMTGFNFRLTRAKLALGAFACCSCAAPTAINPAPIQTEQRVYRLVRTPSETAPADKLSLTIVATYRNTDNRPVYVWRCGEAEPFVELEKWENGTWRPAYSPLCPLGSQSPIQVPPGASRTDTVRMMSYDSQTYYPRLDVGDESGTYRLSYRLYGSAQLVNGVRVLGDALEEDSRVSNEFRVEPALKTR